MDGLLRKGSGPGMPGPYRVAVQQALHFRKRARRPVGRLPYRPRFALCVGRDAPTPPKSVRRLRGVGDAAPYLDASRMLSARISPSSVIMVPFLSG